MKFLGILIALLPALTFADCCCEDDFLYFDEPDHECLSHIEVEEESDTCYSSQPFKPSAKALREAVEMASDGQITEFIERRATEIDEESEEFFDYDFSQKNDLAEYTPSFEKIPEQKKQLIGSRPRVVQEATQECQRTQAPTKERPPLAKDKVPKKEDKEKLVYSD